MKNLPEAYRSLKTRIEASSAMSVLFDLTVMWLAPLAASGRHDTRKAPALGVRAMTGADGVFDAKAAAEILALGWIDGLTRQFLRVGSIEPRHLDDAMLPILVPIDPLPGALAGVGLGIEGAREALRDLRETLPDDRHLPDQIVGILAILGWAVKPASLAGDRFASVPANSLRAGGYDPGVIAVAKAGTLRYLLRRTTEARTFRVSLLKRESVVDVTGYLDAAGAPIPRDAAMRIRSISCRPIGRLTVPAGASGSVPVTTAVAEFDRLLSRRGLTYGRLVYAT